MLLQDVPVVELRALRRHHDDLQHELDLILVGADHGSEDTHVPQRLVELSRRLRGEYAAQRDLLQQEAERAAAAGLERFDVSLRMPVEAAAQLEDALAAYEAVDAWCRRGELLTLATPPELAELRRALVERVIAQLRD